MDWSGASAGGLFGADLAKEGNSPSLRVHGSLLNGVLHD